MTLTETQRRAACIAAYRTGYVLGQRAKQIGRATCTSDHPMNIADQNYFGEGYRDGLAGLAPRWPQ